MCSSDLDNFVGCSFDDVGGGSECHGNFCGEPAYCIWWSMEANVFMAAYSLSVRGDRGDWADGFARAWIMSLTADLMISVD